MDTVREAFGEQNKTPPLFVDQVLDESRTNLIKYVVGTPHVLGLHTNGQESEALSEHESLQGLYDFLNSAVEANPADSFAGDKARSMIDNLTFIGEKEYGEATMAIAASGKKH